MLRCAIKMAADVGLVRQCSPAIQATLSASLGQGLLGQPAQPLPCAPPAAAAFPRGYSAMPEPLPQCSSSDSSGSERDAAYHRRLAEMSQGSRTRRAVLPSTEETAARLQTHKAASCSGQTSQQEPAPALDWRDAVRLSRQAAISGQDMLTDSFGQVPQLPGRHQSCPATCRRTDAPVMEHLPAVLLPALATLQVHANAGARRFMASVCEHAKRHRCWIAQAHAHVSAHLADRAVQPALPVLHAGRGRSPRAQRGPAHHRGDYASCVWPSLSSHDCIQCPCPGLCETIPAPSP